MDKEWPADEENEEGWDDDYNVEAVQIVSTDTKTLSTATTFKVSTMDEVYTKQIPD